MIPITGSTLPTGDARHIRVLQAALLLAEALALVILKGTLRGYHKGSYKVSIRVTIRALSHITHNAILS